MGKFSLTHILRMTDSLGILEHCIFTTPDRKEGYSTDDNARALQTFLRLKDSRTSLYLQFLLRAQTKKGFHQDLNPDLTWKDDDGVGEGFGRAMAALGEATLTALEDNQKLTAAFAFDAQLPLIKNVNYPRVIAQLIFGIFHRMKFAPQLKKELISLAEKLAKYYLTHSTTSWKWYEDILTYDNGRLPLGMFYAYQASGNKKYYKIALESLDFLLEKTYDLSKDCFSFPRNQGWFPKDGEKALFGQQPIEAGSTVEVCAKAYQLTKNKKYLDFAQKALDWYKGKNILGISLLDEQTDGVCDGLEERGVNRNQGAESILSYAIACLSLEKVKS